eukprot:SAG31_NODE_3158_length_4610_cov_2.329417_5_plen_119_part_00
MSRWARSQSVEMVKSYGLRVIVISLSAGSSRGRSGGLSVTVIPRSTTSSVPHTYFGRVQGEYAVASVTEVGNGPGTFAEQKHVTTSYVALDDYAPAFRLPILRVAGWQLTLSLLPLSP